MTMTDDERDELSARDKFILHKKRQGYKINEIQIFLKNEGFIVPHRASIYNILKKG